MFVRLKPRCAYVGTGQDYPLQIAWTEPNGQFLLKNKLGFLIQYKHLVERIHRYNYYYFIEGSVGGKVWKTLRYRTQDAFARVMRA